MSAFEQESWMWYRDSVTPATIEAGLISRFWPELEGAAGELFLKAFNRIHGMFARIKAEKAQDKK
jgi:hypothetical protein